MSNCIYCPPSIKGGIPDEAIKAWHDKGHPLPAFADFERALINPAPTLESGGDLDG